MQIEINLPADADTGLRWMRQEEGASTEGVVRAAVGLMRYLVDETAKGAQFSLYEPRRHRWQSGGRWYRFFPPEPRSETGAASRVTVAFSDDSVAVLDRLARRYGSSRNTLVVDGLRLLTLAMVKRRQGWELLMRQPTLRSREMRDGREYVVEHRPRDRYLSIGVKSFFAPVAPPAPDAGRTVD